MTAEPGRTETEVLELDLVHLESVWESGMRDAYLIYRVHAEPPVALAAAMVESAAELQQLGGPAPEPARLLLGDLCLARASRLVAATRDQNLQVAFARAVEAAAAAAAAGESGPPVRDLLLAAVHA